MIKVDGKEYNVDITELGLDVKFIYKYAQRTENFELKYELGAVYYNQQITFGTTESSNRDFRELFTILSTKSTIDAGTGHNVEIQTPLGKMTFLMYPDKLSLNLLMLDKAKDTSWWTGFTVKFIAVKPAERW